MLVRGSEDARIAVVRERKARGKILHRDVGKVRGNRGNGRGLDPLADGEDLVLFGDADGVKEVGVLCPDGALAPGKDVGFKPHLLCL